MGLSASAKEMPREMSYYGGYITYHNFLKSIAEAYSSRAGELYDKWTDPFGDGLDDSEYEELVSLIPQGMMILLCHPDGEGKFTPKECRRILRELEKINVEAKGHDYTNPGIVYRMSDKWKGMLGYCVKRRVNLYYS